jgi:hypothetical protein
VKVGYFAQYRVEMLKPMMTVLDTARDMPNPVSEQVARLSSFVSLPRRRRVQNNRCPQRRRKKRASHS